MFLRLLSRFNWQKSCRTISLLAAVLLLVTPSPSFSEAFPEQFSTTYILSKGIINFGETTRTLKPVGDGKFVYESYTVAIGIFSWLLKGHIMERSLWDYHDNTLRPLEYIYEKVGGKQRDAKLIFNWSNNTVTNTINTEVWSMDIPPGTQDKLLYQLSIMHDLELGKREMTYSVADGGKLKIYHIVTVGEEELETPLGKLHTVKVTRIGDSRKTTMWCASKLRYLPVKIEQEEKNEGRLVAMISKVEGISLNHLTQK